jgi:phage baseplate assembly protein W
MTYPGGIELIQQSIAIILGTEPRERIYAAELWLRAAPIPDGPEPCAASWRRKSRQLRIREPRVRLVNVAVTLGEGASLVWIDIALLAANAAARRDHVLKGIEASAGAALFETDDEAGVATGSSDLFDSAVRHQTGLRNRPEAAARGT